MAGFFMRWRSIRLYSAAPSIQPDRPRLGGKPTATLTMHNDTASQLFIIKSNAKKERGAEIQHTHPATCEAGIGRPYSSIVRRLQSANKPADYFVARPTVRDPQYLDQDLQ
jgi:hypothetical protein